MASFGRLGKGFTEKSGTLDKWCGKCHHKYRIRIRDMDTDDLLDFAKHLGFDGIDGDLFYESYYQLDNDEYEEAFQD